MKDFVLDQPIAQYITDHTTRPDALLDALAAETRQATGDRAGMQISPTQGRLLTMLTELLAPSVAVEVGTFTGYSSICLARGLRGGHLHCFDLSAEWTAMAERYWREAGVADRITLTLGPAVETLAGFEATIDLTFIDADKPNYPAYYELIMARLRPGGLILVDNTLWTGHVADPSRTDPSTQTMRDFNDLVIEDPRVTTTILPIADGLTMIRKND
ncbi:O-methyltransferase [Nonomuraea sp. NBC_01738]|uniref:O-methyltransferase n=1 Tax=Nonomuraea sp. NBC_01738 TaxID=2976003 RepID=UPI002E0F68B3|nr:O-methyltransferase [Nonomuraea sp. NBC_01738]